MKTKLTIFLSILVIYNGIRYLVYIINGSTQTYDYVMFSINVLALVFVIYSILKDRSLNSRKKRKNS